MILASIMSLFLITNRFECYGIYLSLENLVIKQELEFGSIKNHPKIKKLMLGLDKKEVKDILGNPSYIWHNKNTEVYKYLFYKTHITIEYDTNNKIVNILSGIG